MENFVSTKIYHLIQRLPGNDRWDHPIQQISTYFCGLTHRCSAFVHDWSGFSRNNPLQEGE
jgi:hypothetical protein